MHTMNDVSTLRLYVLRAIYLFIFVGLAVIMWPLYLRSPEGLEHMKGVVRSVLVAVSLLALLGIRYPLKMLPLLFFELLWKLLWMLAVGLPLWYSGNLDAANAGTIFDNTVGLVLLPLAIPWGYVWTHYVKASGDRWTGRAMES
jgi:hypothetical protein